MSYRYLRFLIVSIIYILLIVWIGNYWLLLGLVILFDIYITEKVNWTFWKKRDGHNSSFVEWLDAIIFAVLAVSLINIFLFQNYKIPTPSMEKSLLVGDHLFVSKLAYGPRMPNTPIAFPFTQHTMPILKSKSWSDIVYWPYKRLVGTGKIKNGDPIVFNFPEGDTVVLENPNVSYYEIVRSEARSIKDGDYRHSGELKNDSYYTKLAREEILKKFTIVYRPVDRRDNYVKRCIGLPGDTVLIKENSVFVNGIKASENETQQIDYIVYTDRTKINPKAFQRLDISISDQQQFNNGYVLPLTKNNSETISKFSNIRNVMAYHSKDEFDPTFYPYKKQLKWRVDNYGPIWIPAKGVTIKIDTSNICFYNRIIDVYENNDLRIEGNKIYINNIQTDSYTFKMDYYWMMGDNRHRSADSRYWGFVPEDHIVGKPKYIWLSIDKEAKGFNRIRMKRFFMSIR